MSQPNELKSLGLRRPLSVEQEKRLVRLFLEGETKAVLARRFSVSETCLNNVLKRHAAATRPNQERG